MVKIEKLEGVGSFPRKKKKMTRRGIEAGLNEMHEFLQVDFCKFLPVVFATKNPRQIFDASSYPFNVPSQPAWCSESERLAECICF